MGKNWKKKLGGSLLCVCSRHNGWKETKETLKIQNKKNKQLNYLL